MGWSTDERLEYDLLVVGGNYQKQHEKDSGYDFLILDRAFLQFQENHKRAN